jgi:dipeptidyl aminopeptidase/acylaminoacyl peptidase
MTTRAPFGTWPSPITAEVATAGIKGFSALCIDALDDDALYWLESRPDERGRTTLMRHDANGTRELTPAPFNVRSRVHEYGGGALLVARGNAYVVDLVEQNIHAVDVETGSLRAVTTSSVEDRFADMVLDERRRRLVCVRERHDGDVVTNSLVAVDLASGGITTLHARHDFYAAPRISADGSHLCFLSWDHPNMPWDGTQLQLAVLQSDGTLGEATVVAGGADESIVQAEFVGNGHRLVFASDRTGWWNLHSYDASGLYCIHQDAAEFGLPHWQFGTRTFTPLSGTHVASLRMENGGTDVVLMDIDSGMVTPLELDWAHFDAPIARGHTLYLIAHAPDRHSAVIAVDLGNRQQRIVASAGKLPVPATFLAAPESVRFPTRDGHSAHAYFYPPQHAEFDGVEDERPPLIVMSHGGPTSAARVGLNMRIQYYTSRGWAVVDVNYRGSTGFGRAYRDALKARWGIVDVQDCEDAVAFLAANGRIDPDRVAIRGGSAGGYTTLAALCFGNRFKAGASHYGVGDLEALARDTHKFESRYLDSLIGPYPERQDLYRDRSPIHHVDRLECPVIVLQGLEDRIVPPNQAEAIVAAVARKGLPMAYVAFADEAHGFRDADNIRRALASEHAFFSRVFGIDAPDLVDLEIVNG